MITMNQMDAEHSSSHYYETIRMIFAITLLVLGGMMAVAGLLAENTGMHVMLVIAVALVWAIVGIGMLMHQSWADWGFVVISGMMLFGSAVAVIRTESLVRSGTLNQLFAVVIGLYFAWGLWTLTRPAARSKG